MMKNKIKINHIGIVVRNIEKSLSTYIEDYGYDQISDILTIDNQRVKVVLLNCGNDVNVELIQPLSSESPVTTALNRGGGINHICYETEHFEEILEKFKNKVVREARPSPESYFNKGRTFFIFRKGELIEFLEKK
jgi:methylmalonyl-CoA/ethylmalonyl-CoA epimerase